MEFKDRIRTLREEKGLTQKEFADIIKLTTATISKYELGNLEPNLTKLRLMAEYFECSIDYLIGRTPIRQMMDCTLLAPEEEELISVFRKLTDSGKDEVMSFTGWTLERSRKKQTSSNLENSKAEDETSATKLA